MLGVVVTSRARAYGTRDVVEKMVVWSESHEEYWHYARLFLLAYAFLLRLPSEALPVNAGCTEDAAALYMHGDNLCLNLKRR